MVKIIALLPFLLLFGGCRREAGPEVSKLTEEFVNTALAFSPVSATAIGLHHHEGQKLDELLDDWSSQALDRQGKFYAKMKARLAGVKEQGLDPQARADLGMLRDQVELALFELNVLQSALHNPTIYVETLGNALFTPLVVEYAPKPDRFRHIIARLQKVPLYLDQAGSNLVSAPLLWTQVAAEENEGNISLVDKTLRAEAPADMRDAYARAARPALEAMRKFQDYLKNRLTPRDAWEWRLGRERYATKYRHALASGIEPENALQSAERDLASTRARMFEISKPIHRSIAASHRDHEDLGRLEQENQVIGEALAHIAERRSTRESYLNDARRDLEEARAFVASKKLLTLPQRGNLKVIETPEFMRGIYAVGGFNPAPALEPQLGAFYWVTPIPKDWPQERVDSKLREYNFYKLKLLTIHEAMPGHYVQFEFANGVEPNSRRLLRGVFGSGPYIEGWAQYATRTMLDEGFERSPEMELTFLKEELRVLANAILDIRLHMLNMTDQEAIDLMRKQTFQETEEATAKLRRAKLSSCQLPTYYVGWRGWTKVRDEYRQRKGAAFSLAAFHDEALRQGAAPLSHLGGMLR
jgi:uncharacterized protein (DUF885 family)